MLEEVKCDLYRITGKEYSRKDFLKYFFVSKTFRLLYFYRRRRKSNDIITKIAFARAYSKADVELPWQAKIDSGMLIIHPKAITINSQTTAGKNLTILKGATIGSIKTGKKEGVPSIGNNVYVGVNSTVVGGIHIGDNVLIAANSFVDFDVPDNSIVIGNPAVIHYKENASQPYITNPS